MTVYQNLNSFGMTPLKGMVTAIPSSHTISAQILSSSSNSLVAGSPVKLVTGTAQIILVDLAGATDTILGFIVWNPKKNAYTGGDLIELAMPGSVMLMESGASFDRGQNLEFVASGTKVIAYAGVNGIIGVALDTATASGQLVRALIRTVAEYSSSSSSSSCRSSSSCSSSSSCRSSSSSSSSSSA